jgi:outer membrane protein assembly factor BamE (lipoprotein component of BamABCDE complex)
MKPTLAACLSLALALGLAGCAGFAGRGLDTGATAADVERVMGAPAERRQVSGETWLYFPRQPFGRKTFVARLGADGRLIAIDQRLTDENVARIVPNTTRAEQVRELLGPPYSATQFRRMDRNIWTWHMRRYGDPGTPVQLNVQMSPDGVVREVGYIDESDQDFRDGVALGFGFGR